MKTIIFFILLFAVCAITGSSQQLDSSWFSLKAFLPQWDKAIVSLDKENQHLGSGMIVNDLFSFIGSGREPALATLHVNKNGRKKVVSFFIEPGTIRIRARSESDLYVTGTPLNDAYAEFNKEADSIALVNLANAVAIKRNLAAAYIRRNRSSLLSLRLLNEYFYLDQKAGDSLYYDLYTALNDSLKHTPTGIRIGEEVNSRYITTPGRIAPMIELSDPRNILKPVYSEGYITLIHFWASWCLPCREELVALKNIYAKSDHEKVRIVTISLDRDPVQWKRSLQSIYPEWQELIDPGGFEGRSARLYGVNSIPANFLVDEKGRMVARHLPIRELEKKLALIKAEPLNEFHRK